MACYAPGLSLIKRLRAIWKSFLVQHYFSGGMNLTIRGTFLQGCTFSNLANIRRSLFLNHMSTFRKWHIYECLKRCTNPSVNDEQMAFFWEERSNNRKYNCINIHLSLCNFLFLNKARYIYQKKENCQDQMTKTLKTVAGQYTRLLVFHSFY